MLSRNSSMSFYESDEDEEKEQIQQLIESAITYRIPQRAAARPVQFGENVVAKLRELYVLRQNSKTTEEYSHLVKITSDLVTQASQGQSKVIEVRFHLEQARNFHTMNEMDKAIQEAGQASQICDQLPYNEGHDLKLISLFLTTSCYSNQPNKLGKACDILEELDRHIVHTDDPINKWKLYYNYGTHYLAYLKTVGEPLPIIRKNGKESFLNARDAVMHAINNGSTFGISEQIFPLIMMAKILLDAPETAPGQSRNKTVSLADIAQAAEIIDQIKKQVAVVDMDLRLKARLAITEAGLYFRQSQVKVRMMKKAKRRDEKHLKKAQLMDAHELVCRVMKLLDYAQLLCGDSPYQESDFAKKFSDYIANFISENIHTELDEQDPLDSSQTEASEVDDPLYKTIQPQMPDTFRHLQETRLQFLSVCFRKTPSWECLAESYIRESILDELSTVQQHFDMVMERFGYTLTSDSKQEMIYQYTIISRIALDFPETPAAMERLAFNMDNLNNAEMYLSAVIRRLYLSQMCRELKTSYLLAEASLMYRKAQVSLRMKQTETAKLQFCDAILHMEHVTLDRNHTQRLDRKQTELQNNLDNFWQFLLRKQKEIFK